PGGDEHPVPQRLLEHEEVAEDLHRPGPEGPAVEPGDPRPAAEPGGHDQVARPVPGHVRDRAAGAAPEVRVLDPEEAGHLAEPVAAVHVAPGTAAFIGRDYQV